MKPSRTELSSRHELIVTNTFLKVLERKNFSALQECDWESKAHHMDLQVDGKANVVRHIILPHIHNVVHLVSNFF